MDIARLSNNQYYLFMCLITFGIVVLAWILFFFKRKFDGRNGIRFRNSDESEPEVIIIGSGVLGSALAAVLARDGRRVVVIERNLKEPDTFAGEIMQSGGRKALKLLGLQDCLEGFDAQTMLGYVILDQRKGTRVDIPFTMDCGRRIEEGKSFHHGRFVMALRKAAMAESKISYIEGTVVKFVEESGVVVGLQYKKKDSEEILTIRAPLTVVADGIYSRLRKSLMNDSPETKAHYIGLTVENYSYSRAGYADFVVLQENIVMVYPVSSTNSRIFLGLDVRDNIRKYSNEYLKTDICPQLPEYMKKSFLNAIETSERRVIPAMYLPSALAYKRGVVRFGDALDVRNPITAGGMTVALQDVVAFRNLLKAIPDFGNYDAIQKAYLSVQRLRQKNYSFTVGVFAMVFHELLFSDDEHIRHLTDACFRYLRLAEDNVEKFAEILTIVKPTPLGFFSLLTKMMLYGAYLAIRKEPASAFHRSLYFTICMLIKGCKVLFPLLWSEIKTAVNQQLRRLTLN